ncbi:hypothetical protein DFJ74DRAFT_772212 [Hyaloraphidium curvatum]|nr:hypothetical protein DFJ74DRAFT_772212 [Hyaloraphidium curvatum]
MSKKTVVVVGAGACGLVALKELRERGHAAVALEKGPAIGGVFRDDLLYENLFLTISNMLMAFSDLPPRDLRVKFSSGKEYMDYLRDYTEAFGLAPHVRLNTKVTRAAFEGGRWKITTATSAGAAEVLEADALIVATGSNHIPRVVDLPGFAGKVIHSSDYRTPKDFAGQRVLVVGSGESAFDIATDVCDHAASTALWARTPIAPAPRFPLKISFDWAHDELKVMQDDGYRARVSDVLELMTTSRMVNSINMHFYSFIRHAIFAACRIGNPASRQLSAWNRQNMADDALLGDQISVPTKSARLCTAAAKGKLRAIVAKKAAFDGQRVKFTDVIDDGKGGARDVRLEGIDNAILCTGFRTDFSWLQLDGLDWSPRTWYKHCFPPGHGDKLMFLGWARPHQGGIPPCAEMLARYIALILSGERKLPEDYADRAAREGMDEHAFYQHARHSPNVVDYPSFMESVAKLVGCAPETPKLSQPGRLFKFFCYPGWPVWYRANGPGARPDVVDRVMNGFPVHSSFLPDPFILMALGFAALQKVLDLFLPKGAGFEGWWGWRPKRHLLHGNA